MGIIRATGWEEVSHVGVSFFFFFFFTSILRSQVSKETERTSYAPCAKIVSGNTWLGLGYGSAALVRFCNTRCIERVRALSSSQFIFKPKKMMSPETGACPLPRAVSSSLVQPFLCTFPPRHQWHDSLRICMYISTYVYIVTQTNLWLVTPLSITSR